MRTILLLAGALTLAAPAAAPAASPAAATPALGLETAPADVRMAQFIIRERTREDVWPGERRGWRNDRRRWGRDRDWDGYTGQVCRTRTVYQVNRFGERVRRVIRTCD
jgi:hypothetical protein